MNDTNAPTTQIFTGFDVVDRALSARRDRALAGTRWRLDPEASSAGFRARNLWGLASVKGRFGGLDGRLEIDDDHRWRMELTLDAASLDTGNPRRDRHLCSADFFDAEDHPDVRFRSRKVDDRGGGRLLVEGELEAAGARARLQVEVTVEHAGGRLELDAAATVDHRQLGMTWSPLRVIGTPTALNVHAHLRREG
jgi:polyisoprenoid-binding protein YceI